MSYECICFNFDYTQIDFYFLKKYCNKMQNIKATTSKKRFFCLCSENLIKTQFHKTAFKDIAISMCGFPAYIWLTASLIFLSIISLFVWLTVANYYVQNKGYFATCSSNNDCDLVKGLQCPSQDGDCNCPARNTKGRCDCSKGNYWNGQDCSLQSGLNSSGCTHDYQCDQKKDLVCLNGICTCKAPKRWITNESKCDYNYLGCFFENTDPNQYSYYSRVSNPAYFVEFVECCLENCYKNGFKFATAFFWNSKTSCSCRTTFSFSSPDTRCNLLCGGYTRSWVCGHTSAWQIRPFFTTD
jgi:hypothetical protein